MSHPPFTAIDHIQLAMPAGGEGTARQFYCSLLGMAEIPKPAELAKRGGCWFQSGSVQIHLGVETRLWRSVPRMTFPASAAVISWIRLETASS